jgi:hypothetical protein
MPDKSSLPPQPGPTFQQDPTAINNPPTNLPAQAQATTGSNFSWKLPALILGVIALASLSATAWLLYSKPQPKQSNLSESTVNPTPSTEIASLTLIPNPTADWQTYTNKEQNITFKYPPSDEWQVIIPSGPSEENNLYIQIATSGNPQEEDFGPCCGATFSLKISTTELILEKYVDEWLQKEYSNTEDLDKPKIVKNYLFAGKPAIELESFFLIKQQHILVKNKDKVYEIYYYVGPEETIIYQPIIDRILSTFRFLDEDEIGY